MRLSVGMLAYNEADRIGGALRSLLAQSVFQDPVAAGLDHVELVCVPNGCRDATAEVAAAVFRDAGDLPGRSLVIDELPEAGKGRAWNSFVHRCSDPEADFIVLVDADIDFAEHDTIERLLHCLTERPEVQIATDVPVKALREGRIPSVSERVSRAASAQKLAHSRHTVCGQLYCARAETLRRIWLPPSLPVEDGFLSAMIKTDGFTRIPIEEAVLRVDSAHHFYEPERGFLGYLKHEARIVAGSVINSWLFDLLRRTGGGVHAGATVRDRNTDPDWVDREIAERVRSGGYWLIPRHFMLWRLAPLKRQSLARKLRLLPVALIGTAANLLACSRANIILRRRNASRHW
jgi:glycosyltransferase involved in cell wall biosynthesis